MSLKRAVGPVVLVLLTIGVFWKLTLTNQYTWLNGPDTAYQVVPWFQFQATQWHHGTLPLWDPHHLAGQSLVGQMQPGAMYPLNWILFLLPLKHGFIRQDYLHWYFVVIHMMAALFAYALCRDLKRSQLASVLGGAAFAFGGYVGTTEWPQMLNGAVWAPLILLFSFRALRGNAVYRNAMLSGFFLGISYLSGHHQIPTFLMLAITALWMFEGIRNRHLIGPFAVLAAVAFCVSAPQTLPAYSYGKDAVRWVGIDHPVTWKERVPYTVHDHFGLPPSSVLGIVIPGFFANSDPYLGVTVFVLAITGIALGWRHRPVRWLSGIAIFGLMLALSSYTPVHGILYALVPNVDKARNPAMAMLVFSVGACALAAFGLDTVRQSPRWAARAAWGVAIAAALGWILLAAISLVKVPLAINPDRFAMALITATVLAAVLAARRSRVLLVIIAVIEVGSLPGMNWPSREQGQPIWNSLTRDPDVAAFLRAQPKPLRVDINDTDVPYNFGDWYGIDTFAGGYFASMPARVFRVLWDDRAKSIYGVNYSVAKAPPKAGMRELFSSASGVKVFEVPEAMPRVWTVHDVFTIRSDDEIGAALQRTDPRQQTFVIGEQPHLEQCGGDEVHLTGSRIHGSVIDANMNCRGMIILGDAYSKDWSAKVDGRSTPLYAAYGIVRGVVVDKGRHTIEMRYRPAAVYWGVGLCAAAILAAAIFAVLV
jgi:hypothetical protein